MRAFKHHERTTSISSRGFQTQAFLKATLDCRHGSAVVPPAISWRTPGAAAHIPTPLRVWRGAAPRTRVAQSASDFQQEGQVHANATSTSTTQHGTDARGGSGSTTTTDSSSASSQLGVSGDGIPDGAPNLLSDIRVVLVSPKTASNVGAAARACANFEALSLWVVAPRCEIEPDGEAWKVACGDAVLSQMEVVGTLQEALADTTGSVGFTRRAGCTRTTHASVGAMLREFPDAVPWMGRQQQREEAQGQRQAEELWEDVARQGLTALVFGREENGLTEDELRLCTHACAIPTGRVQGSMNLSHAVAVVLASLFERRLEALGLEELPVGMDVQIGNPRVEAGLKPAAASELEALLCKVAAVARAAGVSDQESHGGGNQGNHGRRRLPLGHIRAIMARAKANTWEVRSLHGLATATLKFLDSGGENSGGGDAK